MTVHAKFNPEGSVGQAGMRTGNKTPAATAAEKVITLKEYRTRAMAATFGLLSLPDACRKPILTRPGRLWAHFPLSGSTSASCKRPPRQGPRRWFRSRRPNPLQKHRGQRLQK
jgi:hypothetical protein